MLIIILLEHFMQAWSPKPFKCFGISLHKLKAQSCVKKKSSFSHLGS